MKNQSEKNHSTAGMLLKLFFLCACVLIPATGLYLGLDYFARNQKTIARNALAVDLNTIAAEVSLAASQEKFWLKKLSDIFSASENSADLKNNLIKLSGATGTAADFIIYDKSGRPLTDNLTDSRMAEKWRKAGRPLIEATNLLSRKDSFIASKKLADTFGPDFFMPLRTSFQSLSNTEFFKSDTVKQQFIFWSAFSNKHFLLLRLPERELSKRTGLQYYFRENHKIKPDKALFINNELHSADFCSVTAKQAFNRFSKDLSSDLQELGNRMIKIVQIDRNIWYALSIKLPAESFRSGQLTLFITILVLFLLAMMVRSGYLPARPEDMPLMAQIFILMAVTSGLPIGALMLIGSSYFSNKQQILINENFHQMRSYVKYLKTQVQVEHAKITRLARKAVRENKKLLSSDLSLTDDLSSFNESLEFRITSGYLIKKDQFAILQGSRNQARLSASQNNKDKQGLNPTKIERSNAFLFSGYFLSSVNETSRPDIPLEKAYMIEMLFQKPLPMFIQELLNTEGTLTPLGWGSEKLLLFNEAFKLATDDIYDLYVFLSFIPSFVERDFFTRYLHAIQQNPFGYRIYVSSNHQLLNENAPLVAFPQESGLMNQISSSQQTEPRIVTHDNQPHLFFGQAGTLEKELRFSAVLPMEKITGAVKREAREFVYMVLIAVFIVFSMIMILYLNLIMPVKKLHQAAEALEERNASFRLSTDQKDEFGEMAEIFNQSISELEELNIASVVQTRLLPATPLLTDGFSLYGKSVPMADLGGDYYDYFKVNECSFAMMLGDVAGHGVGAALIMAIAKAGVMVSEELAADPAAVLTKLHQIILATKSKQQRKVMTFQYLVVDKSANKVTYANAGGCSPIIIDSSKGTITELKHGGGVLGGFKKNHISNMEFSIEPGQAVIFYTDGMVESRNQTGRELGYQGLYEIFLSSYDENAEKFYQKINNTYHSWLKGCEVGDDLTILIMTCRNRENLTDVPA